MKAKDITIIAVLSSILLIQKYVLSFLPNISLTIFLIVLYSKTLKTNKTILIIFIYCILDNLIMGSFSIIYTPFMFLGWILIPILLNSLFKSINKPFGLSLLGILFSFTYSLINIIPNILFMNIRFLPYFLSDIPFELSLAASSFFAILFLYKPCSKVISKLIQ